MAHPTRWPLWIEYQLVQRGIRDARVLDAMATAIPRSGFVPPQEQELAEEDTPLPIGCGQTISQPYIIALSLQALELKGGERVLDIGTGSGYQAALLSCLAAEVHTVEVIADLLDRARTNIALHHRAPVHCHLGDGRKGWPDAAPYEGIVVGAWSKEAPEALVAQLAPGGRLVIPLGSESRQVLWRLTKLPSGTLEREELCKVRFVPLVHGKARI
jgi:protein-L-isoaspartate(D-aspartate) O-methyltransferase